MKKSRGLLVILVAACDGGGKSDAEKLAAAYCGEVAKCCAAAGIASDGQVCRALMSQGAYDAKAAEACLAEVRAQVSAGTFCSSSSSCGMTSETGLEGSKPIGDSCRVDRDCAGAQEGEVGCSLKSSTCVALLAPGATCASTTDCVHSAYCDYSTSQCTARVSAGGTCVLSSDCLPDYYCPSSTYQCTAQKDNGAACTTAAECTSSSCANGKCASSGLDAPLLGLLCG